MRALIASLVQLALLAYFYSDPASRIVPGVVYGILLVANSGLLLGLAYQAFRQLRPVEAILTALLACPGLFLLLVALSFWLK